MDATFWAFIEIDFINVYNRSPTMDAAFGAFIEIDFINFCNRNPTMDWAMWPLIQPYFFAVHRTFGSLSGTMNATKWAFIQPYFFTVHNICGRLTGKRACIHPNFHSFDMNNLPSSSKVSPFPNCVRPLNTQASSRDHDIVSAHNKKVPKSCSVVTDPRV